MTDLSQGERKARGKKGTNVSKFCLRQSCGKLLGLRFFSPPLGPCNGCRLAFSQQARSRPEMLALICLTRSRRDGIRASE